MLNLGKTKKVMFLSDWECFYVFMRFLFSSTEETLKTISSRFSHFPTLKFDIISLFFLCFLSFASFSKMRGAVDPSEVKLESAHICVPVVHIFR